jgi:hypothetical protein
MNERIQELAIQSGFSKYKNDDGIYSPYIEGEPLNDELQEFAELIAKDCLIQIQRCTLRNGDTEHNRALSKAMAAISEKYGVYDW